MVLRGVAFSLAVVLAAASPPTPLAGAAAAMRYLELSATNSSGGLTWAMNSTDAAPTNFPYLADTVYYGSGGPALLFAQGAACGSGCGFGDGEVARLRTLSSAALDGAAAAWAAKNGSARFGANTGLYYGSTGIAFALRSAGASAGANDVSGGGSGGSGGYAAVAADIEAHVLSQPPFNGDASHASWPNVDVAHGAAGTGLYLLWAARRLEGGGDAAAAAALRAGAAGAAQWLLARAETPPTTVGGGVGLRWARGPDTDGVHAGAYFPTFCCGTAGVGYFLAELSAVQAAGGAASPAGAGAGPSRGELLRAAEAAAAHVLAISTSTAPAAATTAVAGAGAGADQPLFLPHEEEGKGLRTVYQGWCGGGAGWSRLFVRLFQLTQNATYLAAVEGAAAGVAQALPDLAMRLPVGAAPWANVGQCCGAAGAGTFLLELATAGASSLPLRNATRAAALAAARAFGGAVLARAADAGSGALAFPSPEESLEPLDTRWQAGWMQGAAGVASFLLHLNAVNGGLRGGARVPWPDEPWAHFAGPLELEW